MPVQSNIGVGMTGTIAWDGAASRPFNILTHTRFGFSVEITADIAVDAVFNAEAAAPSPADKCVPDTFAAVADPGTCSEAAVAQASLVVPAGTVAGTILSGTLACRPGAFVRMVAAGGDTANVLIVALREGPNMLAG